MPQLRYKKLPMLLHLEGRTPPPTSCTSSDLGSTHNFLDIGDIGNRSIQSHYGKWDGIDQRRYTILHVYLIALFSYDLLLGSAVDFLGPKPHGISTLYVRFCRDGKTQVLKGEGLSNLQLISGEGLEGLLHKKGSLRCYSSAVLMVMSC